VHRTYRRLESNLGLCVGDAGVTPCLFVLFSTL
jgi:hypothetical protein